MTVRYMPCTRPLRVDTELGGVVRVDVALEAADVEVGERLGRIEAVFKMEELDGIGPADLEHVRVRDIDAVEPGAALVQSVLVAVSSGISTAGYGGAEALNG